MRRDKTEATRPHSRDAFRPSFASSIALDNMRAQGRPGGRMHPGPPRKKLREERVDHRYSGDTPAFPAQWVTAYSVLSSVNCAVLATVAAAPPLELPDNLSA